MTITTRFPAFFLSNRSAFHKARHTNRTLTFERFESRELLAADIVAPIEDPELSLAPSNETVDVGVSLIASTTTMAKDAPYLSISSIQVEESSGAAQLVVQLSAPATEDVVVTISTVDTWGTPQPGADFISTSTTVVIRVGEQQQLATIPIIDDDDSEGDELILIRFETNGAVAPVVAPGGNHATITILAHSESPLGSRGEGEGPGLAHDVAADVNADGQVTIRDVYLAIAEAKRGLGSAQFDRVFDLNADGDVCHGSHSTR